MERTTISLAKDQYDGLRRAKQAFESHNNEELNWGTFLSLVALGILIGIGIAQQKENNRNRQGNLAYRP